MGADCIKLITQRLTVDFDIDPTAIGAGKGIDQPYIALFRAPEGHNPLDAGCIRLLGQYREPWTIQIEDRRPTRFQSLKDFRFGQGDISFALEIADMDRLDIGDDGHMRPHHAR